MIKVLLVEDNPLHAENIEMLLEGMDIQLSGLADNALDGLDLVQSLEPDLILLDIHIIGGFTGIDFAQRVRKNSDVPIIYISSERDKETFNAAKSTQPDAFIYKPIVSENLISAIELALNKITQTPVEHDEVKALNKMIFVRIGNSLRKILIADIVFIGTTVKNYCDIQTTKKTYPIKATLIDLLALLPSSHFIRICRSHILNVNFIEEIDEKNHEIETGFGIVPLSKTGKSELYKRLNKV